MVIVYHSAFIKKSKKLSSGEKKKLTERLRIFGLDEFDPVLNNHALKGRYQGSRSINVTGDLRALYLKRGNTVIFTTVDSHSNLYK